MITWQCRQPIILAEKPRALPVHVLQKEPLLQPPVEDWELDVFMINISSHSEALLEGTENFLTCVCT